MASADEGREPELTIFYDAPDYNGPHPDSSQHDMGTRLLTIGATSINLIAPGIVAKHGFNATCLEAQNLLYIQEHAPMIPAPRLLSCYQIGPHEGRLEEHFPEYDTYIIMTLIEGETLEKAWPTLTPDTKNGLAVQLRSYMSALRSLKQSSEGNISSVTSGPLPEFLLEQSQNRGPFRTEREFSDALLAVYRKNNKHTPYAPILRGALHSTEHLVNFTHADFRAANIMVKDGRVTGILDWELSGWYPAHWEYVKSFAVYTTPHDWAAFIDQILDPFYNEWAVYEILRQNAW